MHACAQRATGAILVAAAAISLQSIDTAGVRSRPDAPNASAFDVVNHGEPRPAPPGLGGVDPIKGKRDVEPEAPAIVIPTLQGATLAIDPGTGDRVFVCGFDDGHLMVNTFDSVSGYTGWIGIPDDVDTSDLGPLVGCDLTCFEGGGRIFLRGFMDGMVQQNVYTPATGFTGWLEVPDPLENDPGLAVQSVSLHLMGTAIHAPRVVIRALDDGTIQQNHYAPQTGYTGWIDLPEVP